MDPRLTAAERSAGFDPRLSPTPSVFSANFFRLQIASPECICYLSLPAFHAIVRPPEPTADRRPICA